MSEIALSSEQIILLRKYAEDFQEWLKTPKGQSDISEHRDHEAYFKKKLSQENIDRLTEDEFREAYKTLWASNFFGNKDWYFDNRLIAPNGLDKIKKELEKLLYGSEDFADRYNEFRGNIKGFGPSSLTEMLHFVFPDKYCLWNEKPKTVMPFLGLNILPQKFFKYGFTSGTEYLQCVRAVRTVKDELKEFGIKDFIDLDVFFWHIFDDIMPKKGKLKAVAKKVAEPTKVRISSHEAAEYCLLEVGKVLGYLTYTVDRSRSYRGKKLGDTAILQEIPPFASDRDMDSVRMIDVIWLNEDENPTHCFEVEHTTDIVHGLDRLIQLQHLYVKFFIVAPEHKRPKYESLLHRVQYRKIRDRFSFISYEELASFYEKALPFHNMQIKLLGE